MPHVSQPIVLAEGVCASYGEGAQRVPVLEGADFTVGRGLLTVMMGPSGSGKSTLLALIGCLDAPEAGRLLVEGEDLATLGPRARARFRRERVGFVFQSFNLLPTLTVAENVESGVEPLRLGRRKRLAAVEHALDRVGLLDRAHRFPHQLSGGEQQRVAVARACAKNPPLLLADEPTGNLDEEAGERVLDLIQGVAHGGTDARTVIIVTHDPHVAARADAVLAVRNHRVFAS